MPSGYLFTWTPDGWPYASLRALVDDFEGGKKVTEPWRCQAHKAARSGDTAYLIKLGDGLQGIFGTGTITGSAKKNPSALPGENPWQIPITFDRLVDPTKMLLVSAEQLASIPVPPSTWHPRGSGSGLPEVAARRIDEIIDDARDQVLSANNADTDNFNLDNTSDARDRINRSIVIRRGQQAFRSKLIEVYKGRCAITGCSIIDLLEAAHIQPYRGQYTNHVQNGLLLRSDIHTLFDCRLIAVEPATMTVVLAHRLMQSSYKILANKKIRLPASIDHRPSIDALFKHKQLAGL